ncbi:hypothetical protein GCM10009740_23600 [Terrabacter terrae]|uniref:HTH marR-type domain-containing protein n=1 Tax=Terrabacter terrae TaxID=318434 RepID=A0ABN2UB06_9MICO
MPPTQPSAARRSAPRRAGSASPAPTPPGLSGAQLDELTDAFVTSARALVGIALRSVNASPVEVTLMQHRVLVLLASRGEQSVSMLAEHLGVNASNASRVCDRLQRLGLVARRRSTTDARSVKVAVTADGMDVVRSVDEHRRAEVRGLLGSLSPEAGRHVVGALRTFNEAAHESAQQDWVVKGPAQ